MVKYVETVKVRPTFKKQFQQNREPLQYMKKLERKNMLQPLDQSRTNSRKDSRASIDTADTGTIDLSTALKIEVGRYPSSEQPQISKCAEILEQILQAVCEGRTSLVPPKRAQPSIRINKVEKQKIDQQNKEKSQLNKKELQRKKRELEVKQKVEQMKLQKEKETEERMKLLEDAEKGKHPNRINE